ncbi:tetratricopeptide repeat protein [Xylanibacter rodentium]|uniref:tetratricopeptide repeat protein n=1 Tax=Xylanibacter rodentium TaxID=2736289 RepID=UPI002599B7E5|nr:tetratricopeptide repeat protein [Xylanibacter rodentium]
MSKKTTGEETRTSIDDLNDSLTGISAKVQKNMKVLSIIGIVIALIVVAVIVYIFLVKKPAVNKQNNAIAQADREMLMTGNDSIATAMYQKVAEGSYDAANRAKLMAAIGLYNDGKYDEAIKYLKDYSAGDAIIGPAALSLLGDCYVNTDKLDDAIAAYKKAISKSGDNEYYTPLFMVKLAHIYHEQKKYADEADIYQQIVDKYPAYLQNSYFNIEKDLERAKQLAGK